MNQLMKIYNQFDLVIVPFPFTDSNSTKRRPALIISEPTNFNTLMGKSVLAMITTATHQPWALDVTITDLPAAGLKTASIVRMKLFTLDHYLIVRDIGHLSAVDTDAVMKSIGKLVGFTAPLL